MRRNATDWPEDFTLRVPFPRGTAVLCTQGSYAPEGYSHAGPDWLHALDFAAADRCVVAAAGGVVSRVVSLHREVAVGGWGLGLSVSVDHGNGLLSSYSHLAEVQVREGQVLRAGDSIGPMGATGGAGSPHLHFALHAADRPHEPPGETVFIQRLLTTELPRDDMSFGLFDSERFAGVMGSADATRGVFASENASGREPLVGACPDDLRSALVESWSRLKAAAATGGFPFDPSAGPADATVLSEEQRIIDIERAAAKDPGNLVTAYWLAAVHQFRPGGRERALQVLRSIADRQGQAGTPAWIAPWTFLRLGQILNREGDKAQADRMFRKALEVAGTPNFREIVLRYLAELEA